ncbi:MAG TPA: M67 family metallopeptidase [Candidatus Binatia bacterium]|nr:M67 family metallopeptidase [Candidatus Binatia bacterium]
MPESVRITREVYERLLSHARQEPWRECCGLLAGREGVVSVVLPAVNALASPTAFEIAPRELFELFQRMRAEGWEHLGIYHSHPEGENAPSRRDIEQAYYQDAVYFIVAPAPAHPRPVRAFRIREGTVTELEMIC